MADICYKRVSTELQETDRQFAQTTINFVRIYEDKLSGKNTNRPQLTACLDSLQRGDTLHIWEVSRLGRNLDDVRKIVFSLMDQGVNVKFHKEGLEFTSDDRDGMKYAVSKMMLNMLGSTAEFELSMIANRRQEGIEEAKRKGIKFGRANPKYKQQSKAVKSHQTKVSQQCLKASQKQADSLKTILKLTQGKTTLSAVCRGMERLGVVTVKGNSKWNPQQIKNLIKQHNIDYSMVKGVVI